MELACYVVCACTASRPVLFVHAMRRLEKLSSFSGVVRRFYVEMQHVKKRQLAFTVENGMANLFRPVFVIILLGSHQVHLSNRLRGVSIQVNVVVFLLLLLLLTTTSSSSIIITISSAFQHRFQPGRWEPLQTGNCTKVAAHHA